MRILLNILLIRENEKTPVSGGVYSTLWASKRAERVARGNSAPNIIHAMKPEENAGKVPGVPTMTFKALCGQIQ